jgi:large subunit ribosomal protein L2
LSYKPEAHLWLLKFTKKPLRSLTVIKKGAVGRNNQGRITTRHRGGGARRYYRILNFKLDPGTSATVEQIEYDPNRSARIARIKDQDGKYHYVLAAKGMRVGRKIKSDVEAPIERGNRLPLRSIPAGTTSPLVKQAVSAIWALGRLSVESS